MVRVQIAQRLQKQIDGSVYYKLITLIVALFLTSCIKEFNPSIDSKNVNKFVVNGEISNEGDIQRVTVSKVSPLKEPGFMGIPYCYITIIDQNGNNFVMTDEGNGNYTTSIDPGYIVPGASFKVDIYTPDGIHLVSDFDSVKNCPSIDSVYFVQKEVPATEPNTFLQGIQYYVDLNGGPEDSRFFRWEVTETWEYHTEFAYEWYYDGTVHHIWPPDSSKMVCWKTQKVKNIYTLSTKELSENKYMSLPLNYVDNKTPKLAYGYSLLIKQYSLSEQAYTFWDKMRINSSGQGGLYEKQPMAIKGNLHNLTHPDEEVLGFFGAARITEKRSYTGPVPNLNLDYISFCSSQWLGIGGFANIDPFDYPAPLVGDEHGYTMWVMTNECVDCTAEGGTTVKPGFWPK
jgi:hypothetical protein